MFHSSARQMRGASYVESMHSLSTVYVEILTGYVEILTGYVEILTGYAETPLCTYQQHNKKDSHCGVFIKSTQKRGIEFLGSTPTI